MSSKKAKRIETLARLFNCHKCGETDYLELVFWEKSAGKYICHGKLATFPRRFYSKAKYAYIVECLACRVKRLQLEQQRVKAK